MNFQEKYVQQRPEVSLQEKKNAMHLVWMGLHLYFDSLLAKNTNVQRSVNSN